MGKDIKDPAVPRIESAPQEGCPSRGLIPLRIPLKIRLSAADRELLRTLKSGKSDRLIGMSIAGNPLQDWDSVPTLAQLRGGYMLFLFSSNYSDLPISSYSFDKKFRQKYGEKTAENNGLARVARQVI